VTRVSRWVRIILILLRHYNNILGVMGDKGDYDGSSKIYHKCLAIREKSLGKDHSDNAAT
jgi:hypothetical protein